MQDLEVVLGEVGGTRPFSQLCEEVRGRNRPREAVVDLVPNPPANRPVAVVIEAIHGVTDRSSATKNFLRARLARA